MLLRKYTFACAPFIFTFLLLLSALPQKADAQECKDNPGWTCPETPPEAIEGEVIPVNKTVSKGDPYSALRGKTGPEPNKLNVPDLSNEDSYYSSRDMIDLSLPSNLGDEFETKKPDFKAKVGHPGCSKVYVDGAEAGPAELDQKTTDFETNDPYENLFLTTKYWQSVLVPQNGTTLKLTATQPEFPEPPKNKEDCFADNGSDLENLETSSGQPQDVGLLGQAINFIGGILQGLACKFAGDKCTVEVKFNIQQQKYIPGEKTFDCQTVGCGSGFLGFFLPTGTKFSKDDQERDQDEKSEYFAVGEKRTIGSGNQVGVTYEGMSSFQAGTCDLVKSLYPTGSDVNCLAPTSSGPNSSSTNPGI